MAAQKVSGLALCVGLQALGPMQVLRLTFLITLATLSFLTLLVLVPSVVTLGAFCHPLVLTHLWPWPDRLGLAAACGMKE